MKRIIKTFLWLLSIPLLAGCGGGGGALALGLGSLFGGGGAALSSGSLALLDVGGGIPVLHNPEPTSMLLMGTGMAAMAFFRKNR